MIKRFYRLSGYFIVLIIISSAILLTLLRWNLLAIDSHKPAIQAWVNQYIDASISFDNINASWQGLRPSLYLHNIKLYTKQHGQLITAFNAAEISIAPLASLLRLEPVPHTLSISGLKLTLIRTVDGNIIINDNQPLGSDTEQPAAISQWLLKQQHIVVEDIHLVWQDEKTQLPPLSFPHSKLELKTAKERVQLTSTIILPKQYGRSLTIHMDLTGDLFALHWDGAVYLEAEKIQLAALTQGRPIYSDHGALDLKLWTEWENGKLDSFNAALENIDLSVNAKQLALPITAPQINLYGDRVQAKNWRLGIEAKGLTIDKQPWPRANYQLSIDYANDHYQAYLGYLKLEQALAFISATDTGAAHLINRLKSQSVTGDVTQLTMSTHGTDWLEQLKFTAAFKELAFIDKDKGYSITNMAGTIQFDNQVLQLLVDSPAANIHAGSEQSPLPAAITAELEWIDNPEAPLLAIRELVISHDGATLSAAGSIMMQQDSPYIELIMGIEQLDVAAMHQFVPKQSYPALHQWLAARFLSGQLTTGDLVYRGNTADFPFIAGDGQFKAIFNLEQLNFNYQNSWPPIDNFTATLMFENNSAALQSNFGLVFDAEIHTLTAQINKLNADEPILNLSGRVTGDSRDGKNFILQSPLAKNPSLVAAADSISGDLALNLDLAIPLGESLATVAGQLTLIDAVMTSTLPALALNQVNGDINFNRFSFWGEGLSGLYQDKPVTVDIPYLEQQASNQFIVSGRVDHRFIIEQLNNVLTTVDSDDIADYFSGESLWTLTLNSETMINDSRQQLIEISSDLNGSILQLPPPLAKASTEISPLHINIQLIDSLPKEIAIDYNDNIYTTILMEDSQDVRVEKILVSLGSRQAIDAALPHYMVIKGELEALDLLPWVDFIQTTNTTHIAHTVDVDSYLLSEVSVNKLQLGSYDFDKINIDLYHTRTNEHDNWTFTATGPLLNGSGQFFDSVSDTVPNLLALDLDHVSVNYQALSQDNTDFELTTLPELNININQATYQGRDLGQIKLLASHVQQGIRFDTVQLKTPELTIDAEGKWITAATQERSALTATIAAASIDNLLTTFGYEKLNIAGAETDIDLAIDWLGNPLDFAIAETDGSLTIDIAEGEIADIDPKAGRFLGLLNVNTLFRRLFLDFNDLFKDGLVFDSVAGSFELQQGHAYTNNLEIKTPATDIFISGRTGFTTKDYDQVATVIPKLTNTLPVVGALLGPVGIGLGTAIYLAGELFEGMPQIDEILTYQYTITGSWEAPKVAKLTTASDDSVVK